MSSFLDFIEEDIEAKKTLISTMPANTKSDIKKFNEKISLITEKYEEYKKGVKKYIDAKSKSFDIKINDGNIKELKESVGNLEHIRFILNPLNSYIEKMGFDNLLYQISNYSDLNFNSLNDIINKFLDKFELAGIKLLNDDFDYTCYVNEYMISFFEIRQKKNENYDKVSEIFETIYWANPEIIEHIELNFRKLIKKYEKTFGNYIVKLQKEEMLKNKINSYEDCLEKLKTAYNKLNEVDKENISDIIELAKKGAIDVNNYFEDSKVRISAYTSIMIDSTNLDNKQIMDKFYENLTKLKVNIEEYSDYIKFLPLIENFKTEYEKLISTEDKTPNKNLKSVESQISEKESKLEKLNKKVSVGRLGFFEIKNSNNIKQLKLDSVKMAKELYELYKVFDQEYFKSKVLSILNKSMTISEILHLYYSFDYFKKIAIKKVFSVTSYEDVKKYSDDFDLFAMNPTNIVINEMPLFEENDIARVIMNKYRLYNINLTDENLNTDNLSVLLDKIQLLLRINEIENSTTTVEKIWFMTQVEKINSSADKKG